MDLKSKLRRKLKRERKEAIMSGVDRVKREDGSTERQAYESIKGASHSKGTVGAAYAPTSQTAQTMSTEASRKAALANAALFGPMRK